MSTKAERQKEWKARHIKALETLGFKASQYNRLRTIENRMRFAALKFTNDADFSADELEAAKEQTEKDIKSLLGGTLPDGFRINSDPRGYALKIDNELAEIPQGMHRDFGGYGIIAPEEF